MAKKKKLFVPYDQSGWPLEKRVGQHLSVSLEIMRQFSKKSPERAIIIKNVPRYRDLLENGTGYYFHNPEVVDQDKIVID